MHNGHLDSPHFSLLGNTQADFSDLFITQGRHTKAPFCTCNRGSLSFKTVSISLCNCDGRNSNLAFRPQENREGWARGLLQNSTLSLDVVWKDVALNIWLWEGLASFLCDNKLWVPQADSQGTLLRIVYTCRPGWATAYLNSQSGQGSKLSTIKFKMEPVQTEKICCPQPRKHGPEKWGGIGPREPTIPLCWLGTWTEARRQPCPPGKKELSAPLISFHHPWTLLLHQREGTRILNTRSLDFLYLRNKFRLLIQWWYWDRFLDLFLHILSNLDVSPF